MLHTVDGTVDVSFDEEVVDAFDVFVFAGVGGAQDSGNLRIFRLCFL